MWEKYGQVLNDPVRNLKIRLAFRYDNASVLNNHFQYNASGVFVWLKNKNNLTNWLIKCHLSATRVWIR